MDLLFISGIFVIVWWLTLFAVLPFGVKVPKKAGKGHATSAPVNPNIAKKMAVTTIIAAVLTTLIWVGLHTLGIKEWLGSAPYLRP